MRMKANRENREELLLSIVSSAHVLQIKKCVKRRSDLSMEKGGKSGISWIIRIKMGERMVRRMGIANGIEAVGS